MSWKWKAAQVVRILLRMQIQILNFDINTSFNFDVVEKSSIIFQFFYPNNKKKRMNYMSTLLHRYMFKENYKLR